MWEQVIVRCIIMNEWLIEGASHAPLPRSRLTGYVCHECRQKLTKFVSINQPIVKCLRSPNVVNMNRICVWLRRDKSRTTVLSCIRNRGYQLLSYLHNYIKKMWLWHSVDDISVWAIKTAVIYVPVDLEKGERRIVILRFLIPYVKKESYSLHFKRFVFDRAKSQ